MVELGKGFSHVFDREVLAASDPTSDRPAMVQP